MRALKVLKNIGLWIAVSVLLIISLASINTFACIFGFLAIAIILPIEKWQNLLKKFLKTPIKIVALVVSIITMLAIIGISNGNTDTANFADTTIPTKTESATFASTETDANMFLSSTPISTATEAVTEQTTTSAPSTTILETTAVPTTAHIHIFSNATCTSPKTCKSCGDTEGNAIGHNWQNATCVSAKTCLVCGTTSGYANGHSYTNGYCISCGANDPDYVSEVIIWIPTHGGTKYHSHSGCSNMKGPRQVTKSEAESLGFDPCKKCY